jgi:hypothetical protein
MKKLFFILFISLIFFRGQAQDIVLTTAGEELMVKVTELTLTDVVYKYPDSLQNPALTIPKKLVFLIKYANGTKAIITPFSPEKSANASQDPKAMYQRGRLDARKNYRGNGAMWGSAASILFAGIPGPVIIAAFPPKIKYQEVSDITLLQNPHYTSGYKSEAHRKKLGKTATGAGIGAGIGLALISILLASTY